MSALNSLKNIPGVFHLNSIRVANVQQRRPKYWAEISMQMYYATEVNGLSVYLPLQCSYPDGRNFTVNRLHRIHKRKKLLE